MKNVAIVAALLVMNVKLVALGSVTHLEVVAATLVMVVKDVAIVASLHVETAVTVVPLELEVV